jgi:hypothetical protein
MSDPLNPTPQTAAPVWAAQVLGAYKVYGTGDAEVLALEGVCFWFEV